MNAVTMIEGRRLFTKLAAEPYCGDEEIKWRSKAARGSRQLKDAILLAKGYPVAEPQAAPTFKPIPIKPSRGRPKGSRGQKKVRAYNSNVVRIIGLVAEIYELSVESLLGRERKLDIAVPRHIAMYLVRKIEGISYPGIGHHFGRDHSTVISGIKDIDRRIDAGEKKTIKALRFVQKRMGA